MRTSLYAPLRHVLLRPWLLGGLLLVLLAGGLLALTSRPATAQTEALCFPETGQCISGPIRAYWERNGGLAVFGYPIRPQQAELVEGQSLQVQWFERDRLEIQTSGAVTAGRLGAQLLELQGRPWFTFPQVASAPEGCSFFESTNHSLCPPFLGYWGRNGGVERLGLPITEPFVESIGNWTGTVQYFERRRMEYHADAAGAPILLGLLGNDVLALLEAPSAPAPVPTPTVPVIVVTATPEPTPTPTEGPAGRTPPSGIAAEVPANLRGPRTCPTDNNRDSPRVDVPGFDKEVPDEFPICLSGFRNAGDVELSIVSETDNDVVFIETLTPDRNGRASTRWEVLPGTDYGFYEVLVNEGDDASTDFQVIEAGNPKILVLPREDEPGEDFDIYLGGFEQDDTELHLYIRCSDVPSGQRGADDQACYWAPIDTVDLDSGEGEITIRFGEDLPDGDYFVVATDDSGRIRSNNPEAVSTRFTLDD